jgi:4-O-beta-D-mannosyl-D-glucose phosphorylase
LKCGDSSRTVNGKYAVYASARQFIDVGNGGGIGRLHRQNGKSVVKDEKIIFGKVYHTIYELKTDLVQLNKTDKVGCIWC